MEDEEEDGGVSGSLVGPGQEDGGDTPGRAAPSCYRTSRARPGEWVQQLSPELRHGYRILSHFLQDKHRGLCQPFLRPEPGDASTGEVGEDRRRDQVAAGPGDEVRVPGLREGGEVNGQGKTEEGDWRAGILGLETAKGILVASGEVPEMGASGGQVQNMGDAGGITVTGGQEPEICAAGATTVTGGQVPEMNATGGIRVTGGEVPVMGDAGGITVAGRDAPKMGASGGITVTVGEGPKMDAAGGIIVSGGEAPVIGASGDITVVGGQVPDMGASGGITFTGGNVPEMSDAEAITATGGDAPEMGATGDITVTDRQVQEMGAVGCITVTGGEALEINVAGGITVPGGQVPKMGGTGGVAVTAGEVSEIDSAMDTSVFELEDAEGNKVPEIQSVSNSGQKGAVSRDSDMDGVRVEEAEVNKRQTGSSEGDSGSERLNMVISSMSCEGQSSLPDGERKSVQEAGQPCRVPGPMCLLKMEEKFYSGQYRSIGDFVADFRTMLEGCYKLHGVDHWLSKQAQKLELMLEQKLSLLSRNLRAKTSIVVTSKGRYGLENDKVSTCTSTRRRSTTRSLASLNRGAVESIMVQVLRQEETRRAKEEKSFHSDPPQTVKTHFLRSCRSLGRHRDQERKEAEEASQKEVAEWDRSLLALACPTLMETMWEIPAIGHFLCLAQQILNLPEIVFYELERCLLMPQCNVFLAKIMTSLLTPPHRRPTLHRRPNLPYRAWEAALKQKVQQWYTVVGQAEKPDRCAEKLGLCSQFFRVLGEVSPLEKATFHELPFYQKVWLLKGLCDFVYETQSEVQDAVLGQPIHECREVILGYDAQENAYIHFPQFCGADVRVYKQRPYRAPEFPIPHIQIKRIPRLKLERAKCKYSNKNNGEIGPIKHKIESPGQEDSLEKNFEYSDDYPEQFHTDSCSSSAEHDMKSGCDIKGNLPCVPLNNSCCKENVEKPTSPGEIVGYGEPLSPGEIRILENVDKYGDATLVKLDPNPLKGNTLKTCQVHVNGNHTDSTDVIYHRVARDFILDHSLMNHKTFKLSKIHGKKKKKKKKKLKDILNENMQGQCESFHTHSFKSYKTEIQNKLFLTKKKAKHKRHKSGKKSVSKKVVAKKRKSVTGSPAAPDFQLVCTNLNELRELIEKIEIELKTLENIKKKSEKWYFRRQGVKELHSTLIRLLNELLPWEPKLMKAFQRNRARLKRDYDDFKRQPYDEFSRDSCSNEGSDATKSPSSLTSPLDICHQEILNKDYIDKLKLLEMHVPGKGKLSKKESFPRDLLKSSAKTCKRQCKQYIYPDCEIKDISPRKKLKLSTHESSSRCMDVDGYACCSSKDQQPIESEATAGMTASVTGSKGTKPIQALLAKNIGNKVTLTSQLAPSMSKSMPASENSALTPTELVPEKPSIPCSAAPKHPLQMIYKLPGGQCVPIDLQNSSVKIQMQPVIDSKTGEKVMQQVLLLPKNLFIQHKEGQSFTSGVPSFQPPNSVGQPCMSNGAFSGSSASGAAADTNSHLGGVLQLTKFSNSFVVSQPSVSVSASNVVTPQCEANRSNIASTTTCPSYMPPVVALTVPSLPVETTGRASSMVAHHKVDTSHTLPRDSSETKQELKTVCIRDSQSILVRTRGGNTGVVKVQTSHDQSSPVISPSSMFTFTPQLQSLLVSKSRTSTSSTFTSVSPTTPPLLSGFQSPPSGISPTSPSISLGFNHLKETGSTSTQSQSSSSGGPGQVADKAMQPSNFLSAISSTSSWLFSPQNSHGKTNVAAGLMSSLSNENIVQSNALITQPLKNMAELKGNVQPDCTTASKGNLTCAPPLHKVMLVTTPPILSPGGGTKVNMLTTPASSVVSTPKFLFINAPVPTGSPSTSLALQATKHATPSIVGKTYVKTAEQPHIFLLPSSMGSPVKMTSAPIVSQVKDVKIGLTIGQTIVNTSDTAKNILPINILQNTLAKEDSTCKGFALSAAANVIPGAHSGGPGISTKVGNDCPVTTAKCTVDCAAVVPTCSVKAQSIYMDRNVNDVPGTLPTVSNQLCSTNVGNTVAISTVKTGHLSSSVLLSTTPMSGYTRNALSSLKMPITSTGFSSDMGSHLLTTPTGMSYQYVPKEIMEKVHLPSPRFPQTVTNLTKSQTLLTPPQATTASKLEPVFGCSQVSSPVLHPAQTPVTQLRGPLNDSCIQQKIVINTSTPLAPGTQITINGTRFIVPSQGLGVGSHILLISTNSKQGPSSVNSSVQMCSGLPLDNITAQRAPVKQNASTQSLNQTFNVSKSMNSFGTTKTLPVVHAAPNLVNVSPTEFLSYPVTPMEVSSLPSAQSPSALKSRLVSVVQSSSLPQPSNTSQFPRDMTLKGGSILNAMNTSSTRALLSPGVMSENKNAEVAFPAYQSSMADKPHTVAS